jgi:hypothetical protein
MNTILVANCKNTSSHNFDSSIPDILFLSKDDQEGITRIKSRLHYAGVEQSGILYNASRFKPLQTPQSSVESVDLQDETTKKIIRVVHPLKTSSQSQVLERLNSKSDLQIVSGLENFIAIKQLLKPRGFIPENESQLLVKGAEDVIHVADSELPMVRVDLPASKDESKKEEEKTSWFRTIFDLLKAFFSILTFKLIVKIIMRIIW